MKYENIRKAEFLLRKNRFIAEIFIDGRVELCHVKNTGRLGELFIPGAEIYVEESKNTTRKTKYDLVTVVKDGKYVNVDSFAPNLAVGEYLRTLYPFGKVVPEKKYGNSRFDFYVENGEEKRFVEVKGVTLFKDGRALFPDAPTERGIKHLYELSESLADGYLATVIFVIAADSEGALTFAPNRAVGDGFANALTEASLRGVEMKAVDCAVTSDSIAVKAEIPTELE